MKDKILMTFLFTSMLFGFPAGYIVGLYDSAEAIKSAELSCKLEKDYLKDNCKALINSCNQGEK